MERPFSIVPRSCYKPLATRTPVLMIYLVATLALMALTEYACQKIPQHAGAGSLGKVTSVINDTLHNKPRRDIDERQDLSVATTEIPGLPSVTELHAPTDPIITNPPEIPTISQPSPGDATTTDLLITSPPGDLSISATETIASTATPYPGYPPDNVTYDTTAVPTSTGDVGLKLGSDTDLQEVPTPKVEEGQATVTIPNSVDAHTTLPAPDVGAALPTSPSILPPSQQDVSTPIITDKPAPSVYLNVGEGGSTSTSSPSIPTPLIPASSRYLALTVSTSISFTSIPATSVSTVFSTGTSFDGTSTRVFTTAIGTFSSTGFVKIPATTKSSIYPTATVVNEDGTFLLMSDGTTKIPPQITMEQYVLVAFVPIVLTIIFAFPWRILDTTIREMEPFYQLHRSDGVAAKHSILLDYTTSYFISTPFKAAYRGHFYVLFSSIISLAVLVLTPLSSEALFVSLSSGCALRDKHPELCTATWGVYPSLARAIEAILAVIACLVLLLIIWNFRRESGVYANPLSIVGLGSLYQNPALLEEFRAIDGRVSNSSLRKILAGRKYNLSMAHGTDGEPTYGIAPISWDSGASGTVSWIGDKRGTYGAVGITEYSLPTALPAQPFESRHKTYSGLIERLVYIAVWLILASTFALISYYHWTSGDTRFERFMDSMSFGPRFMMTSVAIIIKLFWSAIDEDLRRSETYRRLLAGNCRPKDSVLVPIYVSPLSAFFPSVLNGHFLVASVAFMAVLSDVLPVALANVVFSLTVTKYTYEVSNTIAMTTLALMLLVLGILICRPSHDLHHLPRKPTTVASVLLYLTTSPMSHEGGMLDSFGGMSLLKERERDDWVRKMGRSYGMGDMGGGQIRVDEEWRIPRTR